MGTHTLLRHSFRVPTDSEGCPTVRALDSDEAAAWVNELLKLGAGRALSSHSFKSTLLSYAAKRGLPHQDRLVMGHHIHDSKMADQYSRDAAARPLRLIQTLLREVRLKRFFPDASRAGRLAKVGKEALPEEGVAEDSDVPETVSPEPGEVAESPKPNPPFSGRDGGLEGNGLRGAASHGPGTNSTISSSFVGHGRKVSMT